MHVPVIECINKGALDPVLHPEFEERVHVPENSLKCVPEPHRPEPEVTSFKRERIPHAHAKLHHPERPKRSSTAEIKRFHDSLRIRSLTPFVRRIVHKRPRAHPHHIIL